MPKRSRAGPPGPPIQFQAEWLATLRGVFFFACVRVRVWVVLVLELGSGPSTRGWFR